MEKRDESKQTWEPPRAEEAGHVGAVLKEGGGKSMTPTHDPGEEMRKPRGQE